MTKRSNVGAQIPRRLTYYQEGRKDAVDQIVAWLRGLKESSPVEGAVIRLMAQSIERGDPWEEKE